MSRNPSPTFHPLAVAKSLEAQNEAVLNLIAHVQTVLDVSGHMLPKDIMAGLQRRIDATLAIMWPDEGTEQ